jgi:hypothetical protein
LLRCVTASGWRHLFSNVKARGVNENAASRQKCGSPRVRLGAARGAPCRASAARLTAGPVRLKLPRVKALMVLAALLFAADLAAAQNPVTGAEPASTAPAAPAPPSECQLRLTKIALFQPLPPLAGPGECGAGDVVLLQSVMLPDEAKVAVAPPATLRCAMAEQVALWLRDDVAPAALKLGAALRGLDNYDSYECRSRNRVPGATLSEHGRANALDIHALQLANGKVIGLTDADVAKDWRERLRASACARFSTVLGPGSDGAHEEHIHVDLAERRSGYRICEWDVREPAAQAKNTEPEAEPDASTKTKPEPAVAKIADPVPLPRPRPVFADAGTKPRLKKIRW